MRFTPDTRQTTSFYSKLKDKKKNTIIWNEQIDRDDSKNFSGQKYTPEVEKGTPVPYDT